MESSKIIGKNIALLREKLGLTQQALADYLKISRENISYYENGVRSIPISILSKISDLFGIEEYDLYEEDLSKAKINSYFAFRADELTIEDLESISRFRKIVKNYIRMKDLLKEEN